MVIKEIGSRGVILTFEDDISIYLVHTEHRFFLCDTHLGPISMDCVKQYISAELNKKEIIVFNSHSDWDHIWGNCAFADAIIVGHESCRKRMHERGELELEKFAKYHNGTIELKLPNLTFDHRIVFEEDGIEFIYAPGHTIDSAVCFDRKDSVLFVGDLVEYPIPYLDFHDLEAFIKALEFIKGFPARVKISAHSGIIDEKLIDDNIAYIKDVLFNRPVDAEKYGECRSVHSFNVNNLLFLKYENIAREKLKEEFDYRAFRSNFGDLHAIKYEDLEEALENYMRGAV